ncbi:uncharacterized protein BDR25DRAFT_300393 [Lindgomyces ingoldianus]|uniref:Uncharacterized protein n=1 Tax=Lindgomyces ingoldianus TaxID=673940 RepID=A0ACB6RC92_9PLEO|nr:uncharacterized protein BDR25DRAFT_300393 [Lindgomyces ingoldianus]KAF2476350.1 hypothetical protein BDR25DRAFT_300393 [Lindgomyces ingoldianus]
MRTRLAPLTVHGWSPSQLTALPSTVVYCPATTRYCLYASSNPSAPHHRSPKTMSCHTTTA